MATASQQSKTPTTTAESVRETLESIVVAFVLAFVFRAFIVEAFVIPTGSMATTLYGAQMTHTCSICGFPHALGVPFNPDGNPVAQSNYFQCPNCNTSTDPVTKRDVAWYNSGDRILVHKWPFHLPGERFGPRRWDVTVFKDPSDGATNYIKRLVGLPGEVLQVIDGDVYAVPLDTLDKHHPGIVDELKNLRHEVHARRDSAGGPSRDQILDRYAEVNKRIVPLLQIQRKTPRAQQSLWFNVYDHDYLPNYAALKTNARVEWRPSDSAAARAWDASRREITFAGADNQWLQLHFEGKQIKDFYAYNADGQRPRRQNGGQNLVGDLKLSCTWIPETTRGGLRLHMNRHRDHFEATIMGDGTVRLMQSSPRGNRNRRPGGVEIAAKKLPPFEPGVAVPIEFVNVDYAVSLKINGDLVAETDDEQYAPVPEHLLGILEARHNGRDPGILPSVVRIAAQGGGCRLRHLVLERDVYYLSQPQEEQREGNAYLTWPGWGTEGLPMLLLPERLGENGRKIEAEYFMFGDNSPQSKDSRLWWQVGDHLRTLGRDYQLGTVPRDQLIGKAFFVYWPSGYRQAWAGGAGIVPNFGKMRWIR
jgi:signal peptidase I